MTQAELMDTLTFFSAMEQLSRIVEGETLTEDEAAAVELDLRRRLRPHNDSQPITCFI